MEILLVLGIVAILGVFAMTSNQTKTAAQLRVQSLTSRPFTLEEITRSGTARELGLSNQPPPELMTRVKGLCVIAGMLRDAGFRITSAYRSPEVNAAVRKENAELGLNQDVHVFGGPGDHDQARGLDIAPDPPSSDEGVIAGLQKRLLESDVSPIIVQALKEQNHVHVRLDADTLDLLGVG